MENSLCFDGCYANPTLKLKKPPDFNIYNDCYEILPSNIKYLCGGHLWNGTSGNFQTGKETTPKHVQK